MPRADLPGESPKGGGEAEGLRGQQRVVSVVAGAQRPLEHLNVVLQARDVALQCLYVLLLLVNDPLLFFHVALLRLQGEQLPITELLAEHRRPHLLVLGAIVQHVSRSDSPATTCAPSSRTDFMTNWYTSTSGSASRSSTVASLTSSRRTPSSVWKSGAMTRRVSTTARPACVRSFPNRLEREEPEVRPVEEPDIAVAERSLHQCHAHVAVRDVRKRRDDEA